MSFKKLCNESYFNFQQYHITKLSEKTDGEMEQNDNRDIDQALKDLEGSLGTSSINNKVGIMHLTIKILTTLGTFNSLIKVLI